MGESMFIDIYSDAFEVRLRARDWNLAGAVTAVARETPPAGYRLHTAILAPTSSGGTRVDMALSFVYCDDREPFLDHPGIRQHFESFAAAAHGRAPLPSSPSGDEHQEAPSSTPTP